MARNDAPRRPADACLIDIDGTLCQAGEAIPGAAEALAALRAAGVPFRFATNITRMSRGQIVDWLGGFGIPIAAEECLTAPMAAAERLRASGTRRILPLLYPDTLGELAGFEIDQERPETVVVGDLGAGWTFEVLNQAFRALMAGADLLAIQRNRYWRTAEGLTLDAGAFLAALEYASGKRAELVGKPSRGFFATGLALLDAPAHRIAMVGDDVEADVAGARAAGLLGVAVRTGKFRHGDDVEADAVLDSIAELPRWLGI